MAGRDVTTPGLSRRPRGRGLLTALVIGSVALLAIGATIGSRLAPAQEAAQPPPEPPRTIRSVPGRVEPTRVGAVAAAARAITAFDGTALLEPTRLQAVVSKIAARQARPQLIAAFALASEQTREKLGADTAPRPVIVLRSVPVGYRVEEFSQGKATVSVWYVGIVGSGATVEPQQSWRTQTVSLVWEHRGWKVISFASVPGPTPPLPASATAESPNDLFASIPHFEEFDRALP